MKRATLDALLADRAAKRSAVLVTNLKSGEEWLLHPDAGDAAPPGLEAEVAEALAHDASRTVETPDGAWFVQPFQTPVRLVVVGAVHIAQPLAEMAALAGLDVVVVDPRTSFASEARFPNVQLVTLWPDEALAQLAPDRRTAIVTLTHDPKLDDPALCAALRSECFYVGSLGSRKTHAARLGRLRKEGFSDEELARIRGPAGLSIGARTPAEIAISIAAQIVECLRAAPGKTGDAAAPA
ncbi:MAG: xanthine dehydrogenase [Proteobacteria bacterium]|nr:MAG: xanthine dehydrogenase [Pseudomonadota bacterium]